MTQTPALDYPVAVNSYLTEAQLATADVLQLEAGKRVTPESRLISDLGAEGVEVLEIFHNVGIDCTRFTCGETLTPEGRRLLTSIAHRRYEPGSPRQKRLLDLAQSEGSKFMREMDVLDVADFMWYKEEGQDMHGGCWRADAVG
ncbi:hypothetical protein FJZ19_05060 [Candidatus Pacearchaeota archaeon]|nr:hypothetical protein [Candidatus Pacearchaeota archaeon]